jgi:CheY-like chemotaxis protein
MMASSGRGDSHVREIATGLASAVNAAIASGYPGRGGEAPGDEPPIAWTAAADVAELLELPGLVSLLMVCAAGAVAAPTAISNALERLARLARETSARGDLVPFARADRELAAIATGLGSEVAASGRPAQLDEPEAPVEDVRSLAELLADFAFDDPEALSRARVTLPVAAAMRAALDWIAADAGGRMHVEIQDAVLTLVAHAAHEAGLGAAGAVLGLTGGALLPEADGRWALRVPLHVARPAFLLARQGELLLALPWHSVARLRITDEPSRAAMTEPWLAPWSPLGHRGAQIEKPVAERPAALLALGLVRAWIHLDQVVWRVFARPEPAEPMDAVPGGRRVVRTEEGEEYWVVEVDEALRGVPAQHAPAPRARIPAAPAPAEPPPVAEPPAPEVEAEPKPKPEPSPEPIVLEAQWVRPIGLPEPAREGPAAHVGSPAREEPTAHVGSPARVEPPARPAPRRALIADDSLVARMELGRVLERHGWEVEWVETASEMWSALPAAAWSVVFVDVSLPDARGRAHLNTLVTRRGSTREPFELVALTRDEADEQLAKASGIVRVLRKPFASGTVERTVRDLRVPRA